MILDLTEEEREQQKQIFFALGSEEILSQLSEECCELAQAAQKMRRVYHGTTPMKSYEAQDMLTEEAGDVLLLLDYLEEMGHLSIMDAIESARQKNKRWYGRVIG